MVQKSPRPGLRSQHSAQADQGGVAPQARVRELFQFCSLYDKGQKGVFDGKHKAPVTQATGHSKTRVDIHPVCFLLRLFPWG